MNSKEQITLSVIIVNYNVAYFLEQCLSAVFQSKGISNFEVFVIDNRSSDNSVAMVRGKFPEVHLIANEQNVGFSKANNQGITLAKGKYILLLNPDTVVEETTLAKTVDAFESDEKIGGIGVRMVDGRGRFLPESKRGLPTPLVAFYKVFGLSALFPKSKRFGKYHLTYLNEHESHDVDVLSGAYMALRKSVLDEIGSLDETFFMYGEDIDLSYRIKKAGYKNLYLASTTIIHYKGESTKKSSVNYVFVFYRAMIIFARKHFSQNHATLFSLLIHLGIYVRASLAVIKRFVQNTFPLFWSAISTLGGLYALTFLWKNHAIDFPLNVISFMIPVYWLLWSGTNLLAGTYDRPFKPLRLCKATALATVIILMVYALLPKELQFSRLYILLGSVWFLIWNLLDRYMRFLLFHQSSGWNPNQKKRFLIIGDEPEYKRIKTMLLQQIGEVEYIHGSWLHVPYLEARSQSDGLVDRTQFQLYDEIIFSGKDLNASQIIQWMSNIKAPHLDFKIAQPDADFIIGSNSIETTGETYRLNINNLSRPESLRSKRFLDVITCILLMVFLPIIIWIFRNKRQFLKNLSLTLYGKRTWVGFIRNKREFIDPQLPELTQGILTPQNLAFGSSPSMVDKLNIIYARDYSVITDVKIILHSMRKMDIES